MENPSSWVTCDGCGLPASPAHIAERVNRLELATRYRPIHIGVLFVAAVPLLRPEDDFYGPPESREFFDPLMQAVDIPAIGDKLQSGTNGPECNAARLAEFQKRGYYLSYLSECPLTKDDARAVAAIPRLGPTLTRRILFNYKPRQTVILGSDLSPLRDALEKAGIPAASLSVLEVPRAGDFAHAGQFRAAISGPARSGSDSV